MFIPIGFWFEVSLDLPIKSNTCLSLTTFAEVAPLYPVQLSRSADDQHMDVNELNR